MASTEIVGINLAPQPGEALDDKVRRAGQAKALVTFAQDVEKAARADLQREVDHVAALTGTGFSAKVDGIRATLTDPQPKPRITDQDAFAAWWVEQGFEHTTREYVEVTDHAVAAAILRAVEDRAFGSDPNDAANGLVELAGCLTVRREVLLPANPLGQLVKSGRCIVRGKGDGHDEPWWDFMDVETGELVPGVDVTPPADPVLQVTPDKDAKARYAAVIRSFFGMPVEIGRARE